eukprot:gene817-21712_t
MALSLTKRSFSSIRSCPAVAANAVFSDHLQLASHLNWVRLEVDRFNPDQKVEEALTAPSSWYTTDSVFLPLERRSVFKGSWLHVGKSTATSSWHASEVPAGSYTTRQLLGNPILLVRTEEGNFRGFHNVCRHHAMPVAQGSGEVPRGPDGRQQFVCPYHGWTYLADGRLKKATQIKGLQNFKNKDNGLTPVRVAEVDGLLNRGTPNEAADAAAAADNAEAAEQLSPLLDAVAAAGGIPLKDLTFVRRRVYDLDCNWKVFVDNYLDGGYHIPYAHEALAEGIDMDSYSSRPIGIGSVQEVSKPEDADGLGRLGTGAAYGYIYPNFMLNRYGPWLDTNTVYPLGEGRCRIFFDYFLETETAVAEGADNFIEESLGSSNVVQDEDEMLCLGDYTTGISQVAELHASRD